MHKMNETRERNGNKRYYRGRKQKTRGKQTPSKRRTVKHRKPPELPAKPLPEQEGAFGLLIPNLQYAVHRAGYESPSPIQEQAIPYLLKNRDLFGCAQTGTGKTAAFILPMMQYFSQNLKRLWPGEPRSLILAPTRELAAQIGESIKTYGYYMPFKHVVIFGGVGQYPQVQKLRNGTEFVVATPGRLLDLMNQGHLTLDCIEIFVLDEADRMLDMGFLPDIQKIINCLPRKRQSLFFSATMGTEIMRLAKKLVHNQVQISITPDQPVVERIIQKVMFVDRSDKNLLLFYILKDPSIDKVLVFTDMKHVANKVSCKLNKEGISASAIHGDKSQTARTKALADFKNGRIRVLVATDIAARGIDVANITHVINYCLPNEAKTYIHRIGRTARADAGGDSISFCSAGEWPFLYEIERLLKTKIDVDTSHPYHSDKAQSVTRLSSRGKRFGRKSYGRVSRGGSLFSRSRKCSIR